MVRTILIILFFTIAAMQHSLAQSPVPDQPVYSAAAIKDVRIIRPARNIAAGSSLTATLSLATVPFTEARGIAKEAGNLLEWTNPSESELVRYEVERSTDGKEFYTIAATEPQDNTGNRQSYSWLDGMPFETISFYKIKAVAFSGEVTTSPVIQINRTAATAAVLTIQADPVQKKMFTLSGKEIKGGLYTLKIYDIRGREVMHRFIKLASGVFTHSFVMPEEITEGNYSLQLVNADTKLIRNFVIQ